MAKLAEKIKNIMASEMEISRFAIQWGGVLGLIAHPAYYFAWAHLLPQPYENFWLRMSAAAICIPPIFQKYYPKRFENLLLIYWHVCLIYALPFVCTFLSIKNSFSTILMSTEVMMIFILALCIDLPFLMLFYIFIGMMFAFFVNALTTSAPLSFSTSDQASLLVLPIVLICSMTFSQVFKKGRFFETRFFAERNKALQALAGSIGHEMRNPLSQIQYNLGRMEDILMSPAAEKKVAFEQRLSEMYQYLTQSEVAVNRGLQVISMILDEVQAKAIDASNFTYLSAAKTTRKAVDEYGYEFEGARERVQVDIRKDFMFRGDETAYLFVLFNLIKNALYYFNVYPDAKLLITVDGPTIRVRDTGPGIPKQFMWHLFDAFQTSGKTAGTGLGLAYCKRIMQALSGSIQCESVIGEFTEFTLTFPVSSKEELDTYGKRVKEQAGSILSNKRILIVDDDELLRRVISRILKGVGADADEATSGKHALEQLRCRRYDLVIMDLNMPELNGYEATAQIRAGVVPNHRSVLIVAYSSETTNIAKAKSRRAGMDGFINKPCDHIDLINTLAQIMKRAAFNPGPGADDIVLAGKVVLLAEDNTFNSLIVSGYLQRWGIEVITAMHGRAVLEQLDKRENIDAVLMDIGMPGMDGFEATQAIRSKASRYQAIPIIALTGDSDDASIDAAYKAGMNDFMTKPIDASILYQKLYRQLSPSNNQQPGGTLSSAHDGSNAMAQMAASPYSGEQETAEPLLNTARLEELKRIGMLEDLPHYLDKMDATMEQFCASAAIRDFPAMHSALHSMLGLSGEAGSAALHHLIKRYYPLIKNGQFPDEENWLEKIKQLNTDTEEAMRSTYIMHPMDDAE